MKRILITGKGSYIGTKVAEWIQEKTEGFEIEELDIREPNWEDTKFEQYEVVLHVAGIAHIKETKENAHIYYKVNRDLAIVIANKAKEAGVNQFILLSTMSVYGVDEGIITYDTLPNPTSHYGKSKLEADEVILEMENEMFKVCVLRPPMVYGPGCKGNYQPLASFARKSFIFPSVDNQRSMIYISNLSEFVYLAIKENMSGIYFPQNKEYVSTSRIVCAIASCHNKKTRTTSLFNGIIKTMTKHQSTMKKVFGDLCYELGDDEWIEQYNVVSFEKSIQETEEM